MDFYGEVVFIISDLKKIEVDFGSDFLPTKTVNKGDVIILGRKAPYNRWLYEVKFEDAEKYLDALEQLTNQLYGKRDYLNELIKRYETVSIDIYIRSDFAEIGYSLPNDIIKKLALLDCPVNFEIFSFGMAINEEMS